MRSKILSLRLPDDLVEKIDEAAKANYESRSDYIRESLVLRLNGQRITEQPNEEEQLQALIDQSLRGNV